MNKFVSGILIISQFDSEIIKFIALILFFIQALTT